MEVIQKLFQDKQHDFVLSVSETDIVVIKEISLGQEDKELRQISNSIIEALENELQIKSVIGIGTTAKHIRELADRYKEAQVAIEIKPRIRHREKRLFTMRTWVLPELYISYRRPCAKCSLARYSRKNRSNRWIRKPFIR